MEKINFKKILASIGLLSVAAPTTLSVVACDTSKEIIKTDLKAILIITEVEGKDANRPDTVLEKILAFNPESLVTIEDVEIKEGSFKMATEIEAGSAIIVAQEGTKYSGAVNITITPLPKINLGTVIEVRKVEGDRANDEDSVLREVIFLNNDVTENDIKIKEGSFRPAEENSDGWATITAQPNSKFIGDVAITIKALTLEGLKNLFKNFEFKDVNDVKGYLDVNDIELIQSQILKHLSLSSWDEAGLLLDNWKSNSILLSALPGSRFTGIVELTWNLKLVQINGDYSNTGFLAGYIYIDKDQNIRYYDYYGAKNQGQSRRLWGINGVIRLDLRNPSGEQSTNINAKTETNELAKMISDNLFSKFVSGSNFVFSNRDPNYGLTNKVFIYNGTKWVTVYGQIVTYYLDELGNIKN